MKNNQTTREEGLELIAAWKSSGKTSREFCEEREISYHRLQYWHGVYKKVNGQEVVRKAEKAFIPVEVDGEVASPVVEILTPGGYRIKWYGAVRLSEVIQGVD